MLLWSKLRRRMLLSRLLYLHQTVIESCAEVRVVSRLSISLFPFLNPEREAQTACLRTFFVPSVVAMWNKINKSFVYFVFFFSTKILKRPAVSSVQARSTNPLKQSLLEQAYSSSFYFNAFLRILVYQWAHWPRIQRTTPWWSVSCLLSASGHAASLICLGESHSDLHKK